MSYNLTTIQQQNFLGNQYNTAKLFLWENQSQKFTANNSGYSSETWYAGTLMGKVASTGYVVPLQSGASDGSQYPIGILMNDVTLNAGETATVELVVQGNVAAELILLQNSDTLQTVINGRQLQDRIGADTVGIMLVTTTDNTYPDNS